MKPSKQQIIVWHRIYIDSWKHLYFSCIRSEGALTSGSIKYHNWHLINASKIICKSTLLQLDRSSAELIIILLIEMHRIYPVRFPKQFLIANPESFANCSWFFNRTCKVSFLTVNFSRNYTAIWMLTFKPWWLLFIHLNSNQINFSLSMIGNGNQWIVCNRRIHCAPFWSGSTSTIEALCAHFISERFRRPGAFWLLKTRTLHTGPVGEP